MSLFAGQPEKPFTCANCGHSIGLHFRIPLSDHSACESFNAFRDGNQWCATRHDFVNLQESPAGFGDTIEGAVTALARGIAALPPTTTEQP